MRINNCSCFASIVKLLYQLVVLQNIETKQNRSKQEASLKCSVIKEMRRKRLVLKMYCFFSLQLELKLSSSKSLDPEVSLVTFGSAYLRCTTFFVECYQQLPRFSLGQLDRIRMFRYP